MTFEVGDILRTDASPKSRTRIHITQTFVNTWGEKSFYYRSTPTEDGWNGERHVEARVLERYYERACRACKRYKEEHTKEGQCLFSPTRWL